MACVEPFFHPRLTVAESCVVVGKCHQFPAAEMLSIQSVPSPGGLPQSFFTSY